MLTFKEDRENEDHCHQASTRKTLCLTKIGNGIFSTIIVLATVFLVITKQLGTLYYGVQFISMFIKSPSELLWKKPSIFLLGGD